MGCPVIRPKCPYPLCTFGEKIKLITETDAIFIKIPVEFFEKSKSKIFY